jgi:hypothetical protein
VTGGDAIIGVSDHGGWAVLVTVAGGGAVLDSRRVALAADDLPKLPHHCEGQRLPLDQALDLVERVRLSAEQHAALCLQIVETSLPSRIRGVALRRLQPLPATVAERLQNYRARNVADWVMYREALAGAARRRGWTVHWYDPKRVFDEARAALQAEDLNSRFAEARTLFGPPWNQDHRLAMAAGIAAANG